ncbi:hypothetical protein [Paenibacillus beijingensis]|uniref:SigmaY antisigma factor component n=1 Tax=Paenibacillus beijingensis TaxID=1126833 RepID=A0A0D5NF94_9BACL|nr:hypothetical protein [Paenibacillus beijingensis]AJY73622.1 hypothetical protein VN24_01995 [Paenibacillus beijingensis]
MNRTQVTPADIPWYLWVLLCLVLLIQSTWLFVHAGRKGQRRWFWGLWGLIQVPMPIIVYLIWSKWLRKEER